MKAAWKMMAGTDLSSFRHQKDRSVRKTRLNLTFRDHCRRTRQKTPENSDS